MSGINNIASLFSPTQSNSGNSGIYNLDFNTLSSIKSGSYKKLLNNYYQENSTEATEEGKTTNSNDIKTSTQKVNTTKIKDASASVIKDAKELANQKMWEKKTVVDKDGKESTDYDRDAIYKAVFKFANDYNDLVKSTGDSESATTLRTAANMVNQTKINAKVLSMAGINVKSDNTIEIDKDVLDKADVGVLKSVFGADGSIASQIQSSASRINNDSVNALAKLASQGMYSKDGGYTHITGSNYNSII